MMPYLIGLPTFALPIGLLLLILGLRGRLVSDHPFCRRCGYDLHGHDGPQTCPECGRDLTRKRAIRLGRRRARRWLVASGIALPILATGVAGMSVLQELRVIEWNRLKPYAWLKREVQTTGDGQAWMELAHRLNLGDLSESQTTELVEPAINAQETSGFWSAVWAGQFLETAWSGGMVTGDQLRRYLESHVSLRVSPTVSESARPGATIGYSMPSHYWSGKHIEILTWVERVEMGGRTLRHQPAGRDLSDIDQLILGNTGIIWVPEDVEIEGETLEAIVCSRFLAMPTGVLDDSLDKVDTMSDFARLPGVLHDWSVQSSHQLKLIDPEDDWAYETERLPTAETEMMEGMVRDWTGIWRDRRGVLHAIPLFFSVAPTPVISFAIDVYWRAGGREWKVESFTSAGGDNRQFLLADLVDFPSDTAKIDVILRGNRELAKLHPGLMNVWVGEFIVEGVPLYWSRE